MYYKNKNKKSIFIINTYFVLKSINLLPQWKNVRQNNTREFFKTVSIKLFYGSQSNFKTACIMTFSIISKSPQESDTLYTTAQSKKCVITLKNC